MKTTYNKIEEITKKLLNGNITKEEADINLISLIEDKNQIKLLKDFLNYLYFETHTILYQEFDLLIDGFEKYNINKNNNE